MRSTEPAAFGPAIIELFEQRGSSRYGLAPVSQLEHALQAAQLAAADGEPAALVAAALLHDVGHLLGRGRRTENVDVDDRHERRGAAWLAAAFGPEVTEPIRLHVDAKRYLCAVDPTYGERLAPDSVRSLAVQGGPMTSAEASRFEGIPYAADALRLRRIDEAAKDPAAVTPTLRAFLARLL